MPASVIGVTGLSLGVVGVVSQTDFTLTTARFLQTADTLNLNFGETAVLNLNNTYSSLKTWIAAGGTLLATVSLGIAVADTTTNGVFPLAGGQNLAGGYYPPGALADVLTVGTINVAVNNGTPTGAGGPVYIRKILNGAIPAGVVGGFEAVADSTNTVVMTNMVWKTGILSTDGTAQVTILTRTMP
jgi:hypothetical protein